MALSEQEEFELLSLERERSQASPSSKGSATLKTIGRAVTSPFRGYRGAAVGAENLIRHPMQPQRALARAAEAVEPGFKPEGFLESGASMLGESAPLAPLGGALGAGGKVAQLVKAGMMGGGLSAADQAAQSGSIAPGQTAAAAGLAALPVGALQAAKGVFPSIAGKMTKSPGAAYRVLTKAFKTAFPGTEKDISAAAGKTAPALEGAFDEVNTKINAKKKYLGMEITPKEALEEMETTRGEPRSLGRIAKEFKGLRKNSAPKIAEKVESPLLGPDGKPIITTRYRAGISKGERLRRMDDMSQDINAQTEGHYPSDVLKSKKEIEREAKKVGGASYEILRKHEQQYGKLKEIHRALGEGLAEGSNDGNALKTIIKKTLEDKRLTDPEAKKLEAVKALEKMTGKQILKPLENQILSSYTNNPMSDFVPKGMLGKLAALHFPGEAAASYALGSPKLMGKAAMGLNSKVPKWMAAAGSPSLATQLLRRRRGVDDEP